MLREWSGIWIGDCNTLQYCALLKKKTTAKTENKAILVILAKIPHFPARYNMILNAFSWLVIIVQTL
jgi:hypothetical protein